MASRSTIASAVKRKKSSKPRHLQGLDIAGSPVSVESCDVPTIGRNSLLIALMVCLFSFLVYLKTLAPTITGGDSGELITAAYTLGIPHPPGYPTWCLLGKLFSYLPFGSVAYRLNVMSAFWGALAVGLLYLIILRRIFRVVYSGIRTLSSL